MLSSNPDASYLMAVVEGTLENQNADRLFGVCVVDVATSRVVLGQVILVECLTSTATECNPPVLRHNLSVCVCYGHDTLF